MANKIKYGLRNVYYAPITDNGTTITYGTPVALKGGVNLSLSGVGDTNDFYADDIVYFSSTANQGYEGDLEVALLDNDFLEDIIGLVADSNGALVEDADILPKPFALGFEVQGDAAGRRTWLYYCTATRPNQDAATKESGITPQTDTLSIKSLPRHTDKRVKVVMEKTGANTAAYNSFFSAVYESASSI